MIKLSTPDLHPMLNDRVVALLKDRNIVTISDLLRTDSNKLKQYLNIDLIDLATLRRDLWDLVGVTPINGLQHHEKLERQSHYTATGIKSLDKLLGGGLLSGNVIDVCGLSAAGKTQLYTTIAVNWAIAHEYHTFVVDTKGDFSGDRINRMLLNRGEYSAERRKHVMRNIKVEKCNSPFKLVELMRNLLDGVTKYPKLKLLVIDSLPTLWFLFQGSERSVGRRNIAVLADLLRKLAVEHAIVVLTINIETNTNTAGNNAAAAAAAAAVADDKSAIDDANQNEMELMNRSESTTPMSTTTVPALGKHWKTICSFRLQIARPIDLTNSKTNSTTTKSPNGRTIRILKSNQNQTDIHCAVHLTDTGIT